MTEHEMTFEEALAASWALSEIEAEQVRRGEPRVVYQRDARRVAKEALRDLSEDAQDQEKGDSHAS